MLKRRYFHAKERKREQREDRHSTLISCLDAKKKTPKEKEKKLNLRLLIRTE